MSDSLGHSVDLLTRARQAADQIFDLRDGDPPPIYDEPREVKAASAAVGRLAERFEDLPGRIRSALDAARDNAGLLSGDRLQGLAEIVQNADDVRASEVRLLLRPNDLLVSHNGDPVQLHHVVGLATPWLSTKGEEAGAIGRFGIGLMTLRSLSQTLEVHCSPYHVRLGAPTIASIELPDLPVGFNQAGWTTLRIPLSDRPVSLEEVVAWLDQWDDSALLFLRHVSRITLLTSKSEPIRELTLFRSSEADLVVDKGSGTRRTVTRQRIEASDGRSWVVYNTDVPTPSQVSRARKATDSTTPIAVALPLSPLHAGKVYAGLPVETTRTPLFVNAQFDPLAGRTGFADNEWNAELVPFVAELWTEAALDLFTRSPRVAWYAMLTIDPVEGDSASPLIRSLERVIAERAWQWLAPRLSFPVTDQDHVPLSKLAVEAQPLERILTMAETATLAGLPATLPDTARDTAGRWRVVLDDWRSAGADIPEPVTVEQALDLVDDETRSPDSTIALVAAALEDGLSERLGELRCVIAQDGHHLVPPSNESPEAVAAQATPLGEQLGIITILHDAHLRNSKAARAVLRWFTECGALLDHSDDRALVRRLAHAGQSGQQAAIQLSDAQVQALRDAFERIDPAERGSLGADVGRAISLEAYTYHGKERRATWTRPAEAYLPRTIDHGTDSLAAAAQRTPGLLWVNDRYETVLRSPTGRSGMGALRFLRLLGAETVPRPDLHPKLSRRFSDNRLGLHISVSGSPEARRKAMEERRATYTLQDSHNPVLQAVVEDISREPNKSKRRKRASALISTLGRGWDRLLSDFAEVESAWDDYVWHQRGQVHAFWLWQAGHVAWLDDERGNPRRPSDLRIRTSGTVAIYGKDSPDYLHRDIAQSSPRVLDMLGVSSDPSRSELVNRLKHLQDSEGGEQPDTSLDLEVAVVYQALARDLAKTSRSDLTEAQLRQEFQRASLVLTKQGWRSPANVLTGPPIFGEYRAFAPSVEGTERLWNALKLSKPSAEDCLKVLQVIARQRSEEEVVLLETLRALATHYVQGNILQPRKLMRLALWTSKGWMRDRPVYATDDPVLAKGLRTQLALWEPGGDLSQFRALLDPLGIKEIHAADTEVIDPMLANEDPRSTDLFRSALRLLREDLARNAPGFTEGMAVSWDSLEEFTVSIHPSLALRVYTVTDSTDQTYVAEVDAKVDEASRQMFARSAGLLSRVDGGGRALAALSKGDSRLFAQAWRAACDRAEEGIEARRIELAQQRAMREEQEMHTRLADFQEMTAARAARGSARGSANSASSTGRTTGHKKAAGLGAPRTLVDPDAFVLVDPRGRIDKGSSTRKSTNLNSGLANPRAGVPSPRNSTPLAGYSGLDREDVGLGFVKKVLGSDGKDIVDLRAQRGVGADAVDDMKNFYELKVSAGTEPDQVTLTNAEVQRALTTPNFFLVIVSDVEGTNARPTVRVIVDPLKQLQTTDRGSITLSGVRSAKSLIYNFAPVNDSVPPSK